MKDNEKYQELLNALLIKYGIKPDEDWTNDIVWKTLIDSKLDTKQRNLFYNEFTKLELKYKGMTYNSAKVSTHKIDEKLEKDGDEVKAEEVKTKEVKSKDKKEREFKECPYCAEDIKRNAVKCKHCGEFIEEEELIEEEKSTNNQVRYGDYRDWNQQKNVNQRKPSHLKSQKAEVTNVHINKDQEKHNKFVRNMVIYACLALFGWFVIPPLVYSVLFIIKTNNLISWLNTF